MYGLRDGTAGKDGLARFRPGELAEKGHDALKAQTLAAGLGVTRGSFYWHFEDLEAFKRDLIAHWTDLTRANSCAVVREGEAEAQLIGMMTRAFRSGASMERAVRAWAISDDHVAGLVRRSTGVGSALPNNCLKRSASRRRRSGLGRACSTGPRSGG
jgi:AcrR family transcriptional regulator